MATTILRGPDLRPRLALTWLACAFAATGASAQQAWRLDAGAGAQLMWTSNSDFGISSGKEDTVLELRPFIALRREGARISVNGTASLGLIEYANGTQASRVEPSADLTARLEAVERLFYVEAGYRATQTSENPFGGRPDTASGSNTLTTSTARLSPYIRGEAGDGLRYQLRTDHSWTKEHNGSDAGDAVTSRASGYFARHSVSIERDPQPLGWRIEGERSRTRYDDDTQRPLTLDVARLIVDYALAEDLSAGVRGGYEREDVEGLDEKRSFAGVQATWRPSPRTTLAAFREQRFFGSAWRLGFDHRNPKIAWSMNLSRGIDTTPQSLFELPATNNVAGLLDAIFTTRFPDPAERERVVREFIDRQGLPASTLQSLTLYAQRLSVVTTRSVSVALLGTRNSVALSAFQTLTEDALDAGPLATGSSLTNNKQHGAGLVFSHRLSATAGLAVTADWSRVRGLGDSPEQSTQHGLRVQINVQASPDTNTYLAGRYRKLDSNTAVSGREGAVMVGLDHRF
jgi:uncharacterized protein (PEP-CTERM system associated)